MCYSEVVAGEQNGFKPKVTITGINVAWQQGNGVR